MGPIALVVGELTAHLNVDNDNWRRGLRDAKTDMQGLRRDAERETDLIGKRTGGIVTAANRAMAQLPRDADRRGREGGGALARGIEQGFVRNSPLIAAAVGGALAAGAPVMLAAASTMFAGIGVVAAAQSQNVQSAWLGAWNRISQGAIEEASILQETLWNLADRTADAFDMMRPRMAAMFADLAPQIDVVADGILGMAQNALPGMQRAIASNMPVMQGLAGFLERVGTGLSDFFDAMSSHAPAAGQAFRLIGDMMADLLPILGELLGQGAELATIVLPVVVSALGSLRGVLDAVGPLLPALAAGFAALKIAESAGGWVGGLITKFDGLDAGAGRVRGGMDRLRGVLTPTNLAVGGLAVAAGLLAAAQQNSTERIREWTNALNAGGEAARMARDEMNSQYEAAEEASSGLSGFFSQFTAGGSIMRSYKQDVDASNEAHRQWWQSLDPVQQAQAKVAEWTSELSRRLNDENATTGEVEAAKRRLTHWANEEARAQSEVEAVTRSVTEAMVAQAEQAMASIDSGFAYRRSLDQLEDAQAALNDVTSESGEAAKEVERARFDLQQQNYQLEEAEKALTAATREHGRGSDEARAASRRLEEQQRRVTEAQQRLNEATAAYGPDSEAARRAQLGLEQQVMATAQAYGRQQADLSGLDKTSSEYAATLQRETLRELTRLRQAAGPDMRAAIDQQIAALRRSGVQLDQTGRQTDTARGRVNRFSDAVDRIPAYKSTRVAADTIEANRRLDNLQRNINNTRGKTVTVQVKAAGRFFVNPQGGLQEFAEGGFTGHGAKHQPAGLVHAGEVVWSQDDVRAHGGPVAVDAMRKARMRGYADGGIVLQHDTRAVENTMESIANAVKGAAPKPGAVTGGSGGAGSVNASVASMFATIRSAFPRAKLNSGFRAGDPGYHGLGRAVDLGESGFPGGMGRPYLGQMAAWIHRNFGRNTKELIYTGLFDTTPDLKNGRPLNYGPATNAAHRNHVHWAMDSGGLLGHRQTAVNLSGRPERVLNPDQTQAFERAMDRGWTSRGGDVHVHVTGVMDLTNRQAVRKLGDVVFDRIKERERELR